MNTSDFFLTDKEHAYLNAPEFISALERVYKIKSRHARVVVEGQAMGVPAFEVSSFLSGAKITTAPFNFYPPLTGARLDDAGVQQLIALAKTKGPRCYAEYKTFERFGDVAQKDLCLSEMIYSIVSELALCTDIEAQRKNYKKRHRTKVNKARRELSDIQITTSRDLCDLKDWYILLLRLYRNKHKMICQPFALYRQLLEMQAHSTLLLAIVQGQIVGGLFLLHDSRRWDYSWGAIHTDYDQRDLSTLLLDHAISLAIDEGAQTFGFGSSAPSDSALLFFKQRWGCEERPVYAYYWNHRPKPVDLNTSFSLARQIIARTPLWVLRTTPPFLVPHLT